jgi:flagellum-specific ATP synthase
MSFDKFRKKLTHTNLSPSFGVITKVTSSTILVSGLNPSIGDVVKIVSSVDSDQNTLAMVTEIDNESFFVSPFGFVEGYRIGDKVYQNNKGMQIPVGNGLLGRVVDPFMNPIDGKGEIEPDDFYPMIKAPISAMKRGIIDETFSVGVKTIDGLLTCGKGQKLGIFAGSGVGKSTLMGMIVRGCDAPIKVIALIGERGREVPEFIEKSLKGDLTNTVLIVATSDDSALMRKYGAFAAMSVAEYFKDQSKDVLFMMDSVTRFAMAQREIGLALGEPPTSKGYPPSTMTLLPQLMERAGKEEGKGSITAYFTVLVDGDDMSDPIADQSRSILDGHFVLDRSLTDFGIYPPINILNSASRVMNEVVNKEHLQSAIKFRRMYAMLKENEAVIRMGAYQQGSDKELDEAISKKSQIEEFMKQDMSLSANFEETINNLKALSI